MKLCTFGIAIHEDGDTSISTERDEATTRIPVFLGYIHTFRYPRARLSDEYLKAFVASVGIFSIGGSLGRYDVESPLPYLCRDIDEWEINLGWHGGRLHLLRDTTGEFMDPRSLSEILR